MHSSEEGVGCARDLTGAGRAGGRVGVDAGEGIPPLLRTVALLELTVRCWLVVASDSWGNGNL
jgi:hypothetical protein